MMDAKLFHGVLSVKDGYPCRMNQGTREFYRRLSREFAERVDCTAGVRISFVTNAKELSAKFHAESFCRSHNVLDVYENGVQVGSCRLADMQFTPEFHFARETSEKARIDLWLPNTCGLRLLSTDFGHWEPVPCEERKLLLLGDSIFQGISSYHPSNAIGNQLATIYKAETVNQSVGGAQFFPETLENLNFKPDRILVALGINDAHSTSDGWMENIPAYFAKLRQLYPASPIVALTPIWSVPLSQNKTLRSRAEAITECIHHVAKAYNCRVLDGMNLVPHSGRFFNEDGTHPNDMGFLRYALSLSRQLDWDHWSEV